jgi:microtubule-associated protein-like 6
MGWPVQGCWPKALAGKRLDAAVSAAASEGRTGAASVAPEPTSVHRSHDGSLLAVGYQDGRCKLYRYPCLAKAAEFCGFRGHIADVPRLRFTCDDKYVISIGQSDRAIMVWKVNRK